MPLLIELPSTTEEALTADAVRSGVSVSEQASFLIQLSTALTREDRSTPFQSVVKAYLRRNSLNTERLAEVFEGLISFCLQEHGPLSTQPAESGLEESRPWDGAEILALLRGWRGREANLTLAHDVDIPALELPPLDQPVPKSGRQDRVSALGKYAHLGLTTEAFIAEKRRETAYEDRDL